LQVVDSDADDEDEGEEGDADEVGCYTFWAWGNARLLHEILCMYAAE
jgi:hypothetical protein